MMMKQVTVTKMYSLMIVLVFLMAGGHNGKRRRSSSRREAEHPPEDVGSEYAPDEESDTESTDWDTVAATGHAKSKGKEPAATEKAKGKGKAKDKGKGKAVETEDVAYIRGRRKSGGIEIRDPTDDAPRRSTHGAPVEPRRRSMYSSKLCVGERHVGVTNLIDRVPGFQALFENGSLHSICDFPEETGYCLELIREFYMRAGFLEEPEGGPYLFKTSVRGVELTITPDVIGDVLGMAARTDGVELLHAGLDANRDWKRVMDGICEPNTDSNGVLVMSKDLKIEYRFLNFVVCYNILPLANTKIVRWERMLYMFLLGQPELVRSRNININVPFLIWRRMAKDIKTSAQNERLPFPLIIMRILRLFKVDTRCSSYEHSLGIISDTTFVKSSSQLRTEPRPEPARRSAQHTSSSSRRDPPRRSTPAGMGGSDEDISMSSFYREQQRVSGELERLATGQAELNTKVDNLDRKVGRMSRLLRLLCEKMGCGSSELPPDDD